MDASVLATETRSKLTAPSAMTAKPTTRDRSPGLGVASTLNLDNTTSAIARRTVPAARRHPGTPPENKQDAAIPRAAQRVADAPQLQPSPRERSPPHPISLDPARPPAAPNTDTAHPDHDVVRLTTVDPFLGPATNAVARSRGPTSKRRTTSAQCIGATMLRRAIHARPTRRSSFAA